MKIQGKAGVETRQTHEHNFFKESHAEIAEAHRTFGSRVARSFRTALLPLRLCKKVTVTNSPAILLSYLLSRIKIMLWAKFNQTNRVIFGENAKKRLTQPRRQKNTPQEV
jgi:hypothetical protein